MNELPSYFWEARSLCSEAKNYRESMHEPGDRIGRYTLVERLGSGGFAVVWRAATGPDDEVALKIPNYDGSHDRAEIHRRLRQEVDALRRIESLGGHPNVVSLHDAAVGGSRQFLAIELLRGEDLGAAVEAGRVRPGAGAFESIGSSVCSALSFLHDHDICYLDLKPGNVVLGPDEVPVLIDFNTAARGRADTLFYDDPFKPPELTPDDGDALAGTWSDVYALGNFLAYLLTGETDAVDETAGAGLESAAASVQRGDDVIEAITRATSADPVSRQRTATELLTELFADGDADARARLEDVETGSRYEVTPADTLGRPDDTAEPAVAVRDPDQYVSPEHVRFDYHGNAWYLTDTSTNGTYLRRNGRWLSLHCRDGYRKHREGGGSGTRPLAARRIEHGDRFALVDPEYSIRFQFYYE